VTIITGWRGDITRLRELGFKQPRSIGLVEETGLEIEAGRKIDVGMARARIAVVADDAVGDEVA